MNYHNILHDDMRNGDGLRVVLFVSGCIHRCFQCHNRRTWDVESGIPFDSAAFNEILEQLDHDYISGLTLSGGDPFHPSNRDTLASLCMYLKLQYPDKSIWAYTGYLYDEIKDTELMRYIDVLVDGPFKYIDADVTYHWAGSTNQRVIDVNKTKEKGDIVLWYTK